MRRLTALILTIVMACTGLLTPRVAVSTPRLADCCADPSDLCCTLCVEAFARTGRCPCTPLAPTRGTQAPADQPAAVERVAVTITRRAAPTPAPYTRPNLPAAIVAALTIDHAQRLATPRVTRAPAALPRPSLCIWTT